MPSLSDHQSDQFVKLLWVGNSGSGKTGGLAPLALAGYRIHILDFDNGLDALKNLVRASDPKALSLIDYESLQDNYTASPMGPIVKGPPKAFVQAVKLLDKWSDGTAPAEWGPEHVLVIDSLTNLGRAAFAWAKALNPSYKTPQLWYGDAQKAIEDVIAILTNASFRANVLVISHMEAYEQPDGSSKTFATSIGRALGPKLPRFFNNMIMTESSGTGANVRRSIRTLPTPAIDLKNAAPLKVSPSYPIETGILDIFKALKS